jgi:hypothetical protein
LFPRFGRGKRGNAPWQCRYASGSKLVDPHAVHLGITLRTPDECKLRAPNYRVSTALRKREAVVASDSTGIARSDIYESHSMTIAHRKSCTVGFHEGSPHSRRAVECMLRKGQEVLQHGVELKMKVQLTSQSGIEDT